MSTYKRVKLKPSLLKSKAGVVGILKRLGAVEKTITTQSVDQKNITGTLFKSVNYGHKLTPGLKHPSKSSQSQPVKIKKSGM